VLITARSGIVEDVFHSEEVLEMGIGEIFVFVVVGDVFESDLVDEGDLVGDPPAEAHGAINISCPKHVAGPLLFDPGPPGPDTDKGIGPAVAAGLDQVPEAVVEGSIQTYIVKIVHLHVSIFADVVVGHRSFRKNIPEKISSERKTNGGKRLVVMIGAVEEFREQLLAKRLGIILKRVHSLTVGVEVDDVPSKCEGPGTFFRLGHRGLANK